MSEIKTRLMLQILVARRYNGVRLEEWKNLRVFKDSEMIKAIGLSTCSNCLFEPKTCGHSVESGCEGFKPKVVKG